MDARAESGLRASTAAVPGSAGTPAAHNTAALPTAPETADKSNSSWIAQLIGGGPPANHWLAHEDLSWPDTVISVRVIKWLPRMMLVLSLVMAALTAQDFGGWPAYRWLLVLGFAALAWQEWWGTWDFSVGRRRVLAFSVQWTLGAGMVWINPLTAFYVWRGYLDAGTLFRPRGVLIGTGMTALLVASSQVGGARQIPESPFGYALLCLVNATIALGFTILTNRREDAVRKRDVATKELLAAQQKNAELHQQLVEHAREAGIQSERSRLARELHDTVAQGLVAIVTQLEAINDDTDVRPRVESAKQLARESLGEARRAVNALQPAALDVDGLPGALRTVVCSWAALGDVTAEIHVSGDALATDGDPVLVRVCQEALSNVARHADARRVAVTLTYLDDEVLLDIRDDGTGFNVARAGTHQGHGLPGMAERLRLAGGRFAVESEPGAGTVVSAAVPA